MCELWFMPSSRQDTMHPDCAAHLVDDAQEAEPRRARRDATKTIAPLPSGSFTPRRGGGEETPASDDTFDTPEEDEAS